MVRSTGEHSRSGRWSTVAPAGMFHGGSGGHVAALDVPSEPVGLDLVGERSAKPPIHDLGIHRPGPVRVSQASRTAR
ncbi:MAG: hypothetical protein QOK20_656, partial [Acidimicrobiaceae bacterium]|nr:hypothetical protein [Acidimicrobiaceae bacterium]